MGENDYPVITVSGAEWQAAQDTKEAAQHSLQQLKAEIAKEAKSLELNFGDTSVVRMIAEHLRQLSAV